MVLDANSSLGKKLAKALPEGCNFTIHHLSTPPISSRPLCSAPPGNLAEETYCESHFLSVSILSDQRQLQVYAIEVLIYTTEFLTTLFVSKADSSGYLYLLNLKQGTPSPLQTISTTFLEYLIQNRRRSDKRLVLSLFARSQNQYLFPGSIENSHKHVLDDRGLIKWWCKVVDPILESGLKEGVTNELDEVASLGYLRVPGCDKYETQNFLPKAEQRRKPEQRKWRNSDPLRDLGKSPNLPERCLIPRFPDDPKARFVEQLDDELPDEDPQSSQSYLGDGDDVSKKKNAGRWRSVTSLDQFWEMMSFRQECSSGRLVGFLWATFQPSAPLKANEVADEKEQPGDPPQVALPTPEVSQNASMPSLLPQSPLRSSPVPELPETPSKPREGSIPSRFTPAPTPQKIKQADLRDRPEQSKHFYWHTSGRGEVILRQKDYQRANNLLLRLDYADQELAHDSTQKWINDVSERAGIMDWGQEVVGTFHSASTSEAKGIEANTTILNAGLIRRKKRSADELSEYTTSTKSQNNDNEIKILSSGLLRKKPKTAKPTALHQGDIPNNGSLAPD